MELYIRWNNLIVNNKKYWKAVYYLINDIYINEKMCLRIEMRVLNDRKRVDYNN